MKLSNRRVLTAMRQLLLILVLLAAAQASAQEFVGGRVVELKSNEPVPWVGVLVKGTTKGALTDAGGKFKIACNQFPVTLVITGIGYSTTEFTIEQPDTNLVLRLAVNATLLSEVVIEAEAVKCIQKDSSLMAADIEFYDNYLLLLAHRSGRLSSQLILTDYSGNVITTMPVKKSVQSLYRDCLGNVLLLSPDSIWQVYYDYEKLRLIYPNTRTEFERTLAPCKLFFEGRLYLQYNTFKNLRSTYFVSENGTTRSFYYASDTASVNYFCEKYDIRYFLIKRRRGEGYPYPVSVIKNNINTLRSEIPPDEQDQQYLRPVKAPLVVNDSAIWVFKYADRIAVRFSDSCTVTDTANLTLPAMKGWSELILRDDITGELYTTTVSNGITTLYKLDSQTLQPLRIMEISNLPFISKMIIRNGYAYFLYIDRKADVNRMLYRMRI
ncbi:MAG: carboxypeptidase-like regulatory domain-containing protein [Bacteroidia bacterium]